MSDRENAVTSGSDGGPSFGKMVAAAVVGYWVVYLLWTVWEQAWSLLPESDSSGGRDE